MRRSVLVLACAGLMVVAVAPVATAVPADGNGKKNVVPVEAPPFDIPCNGDTLTVNIDGWSQGKDFGQPNNKNVFLAVFHINITYENGAGDTWVFKDRGPDHGYIDGDGNFVLTITGRSSFSGVIGHVIVVNFDFGNAVVHGNQIFEEPFDFTGEKLDEIACDALT